MTSGSLPQASRRACGPDREGNRKPVIVTEGSELDGDSDEDLTGTEDLGSDACEMESRPTC